jgi:hypothetical protein
VGHRVSLESGLWLGPRWAATAGARLGRVPAVGTEIVSWGGLTKTWSSRRSTGATFFYGTDFREAWSRSLLMTASAGLGERATLRGSATRGWTSSSDFWQTTLAAQVVLSSRHEVSFEAFRFAGAYQSLGIRLGARIAL